MVIRLGLMALCALLTSGCMFQNISNPELLRDAVNGINEEARWERIDLAVSRVSPEYRAEFLASRHLWGETIQIADTDVIGMQLDDAQAGAKSISIIQWYRFDTMTLHTTRVEQIWENATGSFVLTGETVLSGNPELLEPPEEPEEEESAEEPVEEQRLSARL